MNESFEKFGLKNADQAFFLVLFNLPDKLVNELKTKISEAIEGNQEIEDLGQLSKYHDLEKIGKLFDVKENERRLPNGFLTSIYSKLALKNI